MKLINYLEKLWIFMLLILIVPIIIFLFKGLLLQSFSLARSTFILDMIKVIIRAITTGWTQRYIIWSILNRIVSPPVFRQNHREVQKPAGNGNSTHRPFNTKRYRNTWFHFHLLFFFFCQIRIFRTGSNHYIHIYLLPWSWPYQRLQ